MSFYPIRRMRRLRGSAQMRRMVREVTLCVDDLIAPLFVVEGSGIEQPISSMPGQYRYSVDKLVEAVQRIDEAGIPAILLFGIPDSKDSSGSAALGKHGIVQRAIRAIKAKGCRPLIITDVCLCAYMDHGHCGVIEHGIVKNDPSVDLLVAQAVSHARAGADGVAPSDMMDGRIGAIREGLDEAGLEEVFLISYAAKYSSAFYGPFREAADSAPQFGDRKSYQMDPGVRRQASAEMELDVDEGADMIMVKPAMPYLDIISDARDLGDLPVVAYQVSGEFSMIEAAAANGWVDRKGVILESLTSIKRAGADLIITYFALDTAGWLRE